MLTRVAPEKKTLTNNFRIKEVWQSQNKHKTQRFLGFVSLENQIKGVDTVNYYSKQIVD